MTRARKRGMRAQENITAQGTQGNSKFFQLRLIKLYARSTKIVKFYRLVSCNRA